MRDPAVLLFILPLSPLADWSDLQWPLVGLLLAIALIAGVWWANGRLGKEINRRLEEVRASERLVNQALELSTDGMWDWNIVTGEVLFSPLWCKEFGYSVEELNPHINGWEQLMHPEDLPRLHSLLEWHFRGESPPIEFECRMRRRDGTYRWNLARGRVVQRGEAGRPLRLVAIDTDITARRDAEESLRRSEERYRSLVLSISSVVWTADAEGNFIAPQPSWEKYTGQPWEAHRDMGWTQAIHQKDLLSLQEALRGAVQGKIAYEARGRLWHQASASYRRFVVRATPLLHADGSIREWIGALTDVENQAQAEDALRVTEERMRIAVEAGRLVVWHWDVPEELQHLDADSPRLEQTISAGLDQFLSLTHGEDFPRVRLAVLRALAKAGEYSVEFRWINAEGDLKWWLVRGRAFRNQQGAVARLSGVAIDVTERRQGEERLLRVERERADAASRLQVILNEMPIGCVLLDANSRFRYVNPGAERIFGFSSAELVGKHPLETIVPKSDSAIVGSRLQSLSQGEIAVRGVNRNITKDGRELICLWHNAPVKSPDGQVVAVVSMCEDVTQRRMDEERLRMSELKLRLFVEHAPVAAAMFDRNMNYVAVSRRWLVDYKLEGQDLTGRCHYDIFPDVPEYWKEAHRRGMAGEVQVNEEDEIPARYGAHNWVRWEVHPWKDVDGSIGGVIVFTQVITQRKLALEAVQQAQQELLQIQQEQTERVQAELERVRDDLVRKTRLAAIGQLAAQVAHEIRNPLGAVRNASYYLRRKVPAGEGKWSEYLQLIDDEVSVCDRIISNLLEVSRGKTPICEELDLATVVQETQERLNLRGGVECICDFDPLPFLVWADRVQFRQVLDNLFRNASEAMEAGGRIDVHARREAHTDVIVVCDNGRGIPPEHREEIFEVFFTTKAKGTGLGLPICRQIMQRHGGSFELLETRQGTAFEIRLPGRPEAAS